MEIDVRSNSKRHGGTNEKPVDKITTSIDIPKTEKPEVVSAKPAVKVKATAVRPSVGSRIKNTILDKERLDTVGDKIVSDLVVPGIQDLTTNLFQTVTDVFMETVKTIIYGDDRPTYIDKRGGRTDYSAISSKKSGRSYGSLTRSGGVESSGGRMTRSSGFTNYAVPSRFDIDVIERKMYAIANDFDGFVSIASYYDILIEDFGADIEASYMDEKWGWFESDLDKAKPRRVREGWLYDLPRPKPID